MSNDVARIRQDAAIRTGAVAVNKVLRNTWILLSMTLLFSAGVALTSMTLGLPYPGLIVTLVGYFGLLFLTTALRNSAWGIVSVFGLTGFMGYTLGPLLAAVTSTPGGESVVVSALGTTGIAFVGLSALALRPNANYSWLGNMLFAGILTGFVLSLVAVFFQMPLLQLAVSGMFVLLMCGLILYQTNEIVRGGETNYIMATVTLYVAIYNLFTSLLHLFSAFDE